MSPKRHIVTSALLYANGPIHIGHIAGAYLPADIYVRYLKAKKQDVIFICGSDEHGAAITLQAKKDGVTPKEIIDKYHVLNKKTFASIKEKGKIVQGPMAFDIKEFQRSYIIFKKLPQIYQTLNQIKKDLEKEK